MTAIGFEDYGINSALPLVGSLRPRNATFNQTRFCYELILDDSTTIQRCGEDGERIPELRLHFTRVSRLLELRPNSVVDVLGVVKTASVPKEILTKVLEKLWV